LIDIEYSWCVPQFVIALCACWPNFRTGKRARFLLAYFAAKPPLGCFAGCMWTAINHEPAKTRTPPQSIVEPRASHAVL